MHPHEDTYDRLCLAQELVDDFRARWPDFTQEVEDKMADLLNAGSVQKTGDFQTDFLAAYIALSLEEGATVN